MISQCIGGPFDGHDCERHYKKSVARIFLPLKREDSEEVLKWAEYEFSVCNYHFKRYITVQEFDKMWERTHE